ncbi:unnamed protein product [Orchesella dallaii]|uniref:Uncharacterized protein n=1 Tax=Orchesella dallaii TaxID=48710 RepID=A0ABP1PK14_9HEXA
MESSFCFQFGSIKDAFPKDDEFSSRSIIEVRHKVNTLEGSISKIDDEILQLSKQNEEFEKDMLQQKTLLETVVEEVGELQKQFSSHDDRLSDLDKMTSSTENMFAFSS